MHHNNYLIRKFNEIYNFFFIKKNRIKYFEEIHSNKFTTSNNNIRFANKLQNVWLLNLKRLINEAKKKINLENLIFLDVGCGNGIPIYFAAKNYNFKSYYGIDFEKKNVIKSKKNTCKIKKKIIIRHLDAANLFLKDERYFIFMYNPFQENILKKFLYNNKKVIKKNQCLLGYVNLENDRLIKLINPKKIIRFKNYKSKLFYF